MKCCLRSFVILVAVIVLAVIGYYIGRNIGTERATSAQEQAVLRSLRHASARQTLDAFFWAVNHHDEAVLKACGGSPVFDNVRKWEVISMQEDRQLSGNDWKVFKVRFKHSGRYLVEDQAGWKDGQLIDWTFELRRHGSRWLVVGYGRC